MSHTKDIRDLLESMPYSERELLSDGYPSFEELYEHRYLLYIALVNTLVNTKSGLNIFKTTVHYDGTIWDDSFLCCIEYPCLEDMEEKRQISYHLPMIYFDKVVCKTYPISPIPFDGHTSSEVLDRLKYLFFKLKEEEYKSLIS